MEKVQISRDVLLIKDLIGSPRRVKVRDDREELIIQLRELGHRLEELENKFKEEKSSINLKRKKQIIFLLKGKALTANEVGKALKLSRSRANEYLKSMEEEGLAQGKLEGRKKYYTLVKGEDG